MRIFSQSKNVIFLDRDGVINKKAPERDYVKSWGEFEFLPGAIEAMRMLAKNNYSIFIFTNQRGIARNLMTMQDLENIHSNLRRELNKHNVSVKGIYFCPHGYDDRCECRKPKPGMLFKAAKDHNINLTRAIVVGDSKLDIEAGNAAGCKTFLVKRDNGLLKAVKSLLDK